MNPNQQTAALLQEAAANKSGDAAQIIEALITNALIQHQEKIAQVDVQLLLTEQRKRLELAQRIKIARARLRLALLHTRNEARILREQRAQVQILVATAAAPPPDFDPTKLFNRISQIVGVGQVLEERIEEEKISSPKMLPEVAGESKIP